MSRWAVLGWLLVAVFALALAAAAALAAYVRGRYAEPFEFGSLFLSTGPGAFCGIVLLAGSIAAAAAVVAAGQGRRWRLLALLGAMLTSGMLYGMVRAVEHTPALDRQIAAGLSFRARRPPAVQPAERPFAVPATMKPKEAFVPDAARGQALWMGTCRTCHGRGGEGIAGQGKDIRGSEFIASTTDKDLLAFIKVGRMPYDPLNTTGIQMPPKGGNPLLKDEGLLDIIAYVRTFKAAPAPPDPAGPAAAPGPGDSPGAAAQVSAAPYEEFYVPISVIPDAPVGPSGLARGWRVRLASTPPGAVRPAGDPRLSLSRPLNANLYFTTYVVAAALHAAGVAIATGLIAIVATLAAFGRGMPPVAAIAIPAALWHVLAVSWLINFLILYPMM
jgi:disulfide bond formation protein DsbB